MSPMTAKAKGFKNSKPGAYLSMGTTAFGAIAVVKQARMARKEHDTLRLIDAAVSAAAIVTGLALLYRELKKLGDDDVLLG
ncbi:hypothetical protein DCW30_00225 [Streptomyces alfalfae]|jgi:hypothetical protein|uniref:Uncharacterized protein n=1 Tax=Streptomyces alfalfae TaxID=1642299 RepID=A0A1P8TEZ6_9ACTN|nr:MULTISPECIES: hypothetical protein [Streptomyces]AYA16606.1 hypothetical protein D3X13_10555 [Streptomyces fradiae]APY86226.1 hypothetical protein A7J05_11345 [Streptomyces alfalfae]KUL61515.1 hypothetical protein ADL30_07160 [Streptomyces sp. NRRL S-1521]QQC91534.1 hypothetical protein I8755_26350 [Streptomyces alfalfae]QUI34016.1 hypothetical protein H9W91_26520 [Streptomyces alfalfae]